jgi:hypothetical protein
MSPNERTTLEAERSTRPENRSTVSQRSAEEADRGVQRYAQAPQGARQPQSSLPQRNASKRKKATQLLITDATEPSLKIIAPLYAQQHWRLSEGEARQVIAYVDSWDKLAAKLREYESIQHLVLMFHGTPGSLLVGTTDEGLTTRASEHFKEHAPQINQIDLEGCLIAREPEALLAFGKLFHAVQVTGWNHWWVNDIGKTVNVPKNMTKGEIEKLQKKLDGFKQYFVKEPPTAAQLAKKPGSHRLVLEWFIRYASEEEPLPEPETGAPDERERTFKPRRNGIRRLIRGENEASELRQEYEKMSGSDDLPFHRVVVNFP